MTHPTGDALAANERVVEAVVKAMGEERRRLIALPLGRIYPELAHAAISAYLKAMEEPSVLSSPEIPDN